jgi:ABC-type transport system involved in multi-copper enzyme maturation permease subunit
MLVKEMMEARWKIIIGAVVALVAAAAFASTYELIVGVLTSSALKQAGAIQSQIDALIRGGYDAYIWSQWYSKTAPQILAILAAIMGAGLVASEVSKGTIFFLLSKPVSRTRVLLIKYGVNALALLGVALLGSVAILVAAAVRGQTVHWAGVIVSSLLLWLGMLFPLGLATLCSILYKDIWLPLVIAILVLVVLSLPGLVPGWGAWNLTGYWADYSPYLGNSFPLKGLIILLVAAVLPMAVAIPLFRKQQY